VQCIKFIFCALAVAQYCISAYMPDHTALVMSQTHTRTFSSSFVLLYMGGMVMWLCTQDNSICSLSSSVHGWHSLKMGECVLGLHEAVSSTGILP